MQRIGFDMKLISALGAGAVLALTTFGAAAGEAFVPQALQGAARMTSASLEQATSALAIARPIDIAQGLAAAGALQPAPGDPRANSSVVAQSGYRNDVAVLQSGSNNASSVIQQGALNRATVTQRSR